MKKYSLYFLFAATLIIALSYCSKPSAPDLDSPYDDQSENFISTPDLNTAPVQDILDFEARTGGAFENDYGKPVTQKGVCWSISENPTTEDNCTNDGDGLSSFESHITGLEVETTYYVRAYAINEDGTIYGGQREFTTMNGVPEILTQEASDVRAYSATAGASIGASQGAAILDWGICFSDSELPGLDNSCISATQQMLLAGAALRGQVDAMSFEKQPSRAATNSSEKSERRLINNDQNNGPQRLEARPPAAPSIDEQRAVPSKIAPTLDFPEKHENNGIGTLSENEQEFFATLENLNLSTTYYIRAYVITEAVPESYGQQVSFTTRDGTAELTTTEASDITAFSAMAGGEITDDGGAPIEERGVCSATTQEPSLDDSCLASGEGEGSFSVTIEKLTPDTPYYIRAYSLSAAGVTYGNEVAFTTQDGIATIITTEVSDVRARSAVTRGVITNDGGATIDERGVCYATTEGPSLEDSCVAGGDGVGSFSVTIEGLTPDTPYYVRAYAQSAAGVTYGNEVSFTTRDGTAELTTTEASSITAFSALTGGEITDDGGAAIDERGVCYSTTQVPDLEDSCVASEDDEDSFTVTIEGLTPDTPYYVRAYAQSAAGVTYGNEVAFTTGDGIVELITTEASGITALSAFTGGEITNDGGAMIDERGVCYATTQEPSLEDNCEDRGGGIGNFAVFLDGLTPNTPYYIRAYAQSAAGVAYGNEVAFTTRDGIAELSTTEASGITAFSAFTGGEITDNGGAAIDERGICYATTQLPSLEDSCVASGDGLGNFTVVIDGLTPDTPYYIRAYSQSAAGIAYGNEVSFTTPDGIAEVMTIEPFDIQQTSARSGGNLIDDGGAVISDKGLCYISGSGIPGFNDSCLSSGSGSGDFEILIEDLTAGQIYSVRAYATNAIGPVWGEVFEFLAFDTKVVDITNPETGQTWMDRNLGASRVATSPTDEQAYGDLYQWGRATDGHEKRNSSTTTTLSNSDQPGHGDFILSLDSPNDWRSPQNDNLWQGVNGINNPCPGGYRLPTAAEWEAERQSWSNNDNSGAYASPLKLPMAGRRGNDTGSLSEVGSLGGYWSETLFGPPARNLFFNSSNAGISSNRRALGYSVRCIKD